jgi:hypothetical protein
MLIGPGSSGWHRKHVGSRRRLTVMSGALLQLLKSVRLWGSVQIYGALQGGSNVTFPVRASCDLAIDSLLMCSRRCLRSLSRHQMYNWTVGRSGTKPLRQCCTQARSSLLEAALYLSQLFGGVASHRHSSKPLSSYGSYALLCLLAAHRHVRDGQSAAGLRPGAVAEQGWPREGAGAAGADHAAAGGWRDDAAHR